MRLTIAMAVLIGLLPAAHPADAQEAPPDLTKPPLPEETRAEPRRPVVWHPSVALTALGYDSNVFNLPDTDTGPAGDWVASGNATLAPVFRLRDTRIAALGSLTGNYFQRFESERGFDGQASARIDQPVSRATVFAFGDYQNLKQRVNFEIDQRARREETRLGAGLDIALGSRTTIGGALERHVTAFADDALASQPLREALNREERLARASFQYAITPLTSLVVTGERGTHRFDLTPLRNGDRDGVMAGLMFSRDALITGQWSIGWQRVTVANPSVPSFSGLAALAALSTTFGPGTRLSGRLRRDVVFSADERSPYYVQKGFGLTLMQALGDRWEVGARFDRVLLDYVIARDEPGTPYREYVNVPGVMFGLRLPGGWRLSLQAERLNRRAGADTPRGYDTTRVYTVFTPTLRF